MSAPTTTEGIAEVMVQIAAEDLEQIIAAIRRGDPEIAHRQLASTIHQLDAARRMLT